MGTYRVVHHDPLRENFWWVLALVALAAALLLAPGGRLVGHPPDMADQGSATADYRNWRPTGPLAY